MDGRSKRTRKSGKDSVQPANVVEEDLRPSSVHPDDLSELEALASTPNTVNLSDMADKLAAPTASKSLESRDTSQKQAFVDEDSEKKVYRMDKKLIKESMSIAYSFILTVAERGSKGVIPGNKMNDLIARKPGYQARLDNLLMAIAEEYGCDKVVPAPVALLLFTATVYSECASVETRENKPSLPKSEISHTTLT